MAVGSQQTKYRRHYVCVNPDSTAGPETWRLASPQEIGSSEGGGGGVAYEFEGVAPVDVTVTDGPVTNVETSFDIIQLDDRAN